MSIDNCQGCEKRLDTDFVEYQPDGSLYCDNCMDERDEDRSMTPIVLTEAEKEALEQSVVALEGEGRLYDAKLIESLLSRSREVARAGAAQENSNEA